MVNIILASASPRRAELLRQIGLEFEVIVSGAAEDDISEKDPAALARQLAFLKAQKVAASVTRESAVIIAADTVVWAGGEILGKPENIDDAFRMLRLISGRCHQVMTGVAVVRLPDMKTLCHVETTSVFMRPITDEEMRWYAGSGEMWDKAGGYGIQGKAAVFVEKVDGCYSNVVGLPLNALWNMLRQVL